MDILHRWKPGVRKIWLYVISGFIWFGVGIMLIRFAMLWLVGVPSFQLLLLIICGFLLSFGIYIFGFSNFARTNIDRIESCQSEKVCIFAFQSWTSYPLVAFMITLGMYLRLSSPFPKWMLIITYLGIGGGLFLASFLYFSRLYSYFHVSY